jgi:hypothetical protein
MAGLVPAIHVFFCRRSKDVDTRDKPGHDDWINVAQLILIMLTKSGFGRDGLSLTGRSLVPNTTFSETME